MKILYIAMIATLLTVPLQGTDARDSFRLHVGPGPEDICVTQWRGRSVAVFSCAERRKGRQQQPSKLGFGYVWLDEATGRPVVVGQQGLAEGLPWSGLHWQPHCALNHGSGILSAVRTGCFRDGKFDKGRAAVEFFEWDPTSAVPRLRPLPIQTPALEGAGSLNAVVLTRTGDVYATTFGLLGCWPRRLIVESEPSVVTKLGSHQVLHWQPGEKHWRCVVRNVSGANGLALNADENQLAVAAYHSRQVHVFHLGHQHALLHSVKLERWRPDNLKLTEEGRIIACGSGKWSSGLTLLTENLFGFRVTRSPGGIFALPTWELQAKPVSATVNLPADYACPSGIAQLGHWWIASQILDDELLCLPVH